MNRERLKAQLENDEALRLKLYKCSMGKTTIGVGRNLDDKGISRNCAMFMLDEDVDETIKLADEFFPWWKQMTEDRQEAFLNFLFNVGIGSALKFVNTMKALKEGRYEDAAVGFETSLWFKQVGQRAVRIVKKIRVG